MLLSPGRINNSTQVNKRWIKLWIRFSINPDSVRGLWPEARNLILSARLHLLPHSWYWNLLMPFINAGKNWILENYIGVLGQEIWST